MEVVMSSEISFIPVCHIFGSLYIVAIFLLLLLIKFKSFNLKIEVHKGRSCMYINIKCVMSTIYENFKNVFQFMNLTNDFYIV